MAQTGSTHQLNGKATEPFVGKDTEDFLTHSEATNGEGDQPAQATRDNNTNDADGDVFSEDRLGQHQSYESSILAAYRRLLSRRVDLVGDYAGNELFLIDGDSLLLRCFSDKNLDFNHGFQMLHAAYNVELFLHQLVKRKCNFRLVFFNSSRDLCIPHASSSSNASKYRLARAAIIRHLQCELKAVDTAIPVNEFPSHDSSDFAQYLRDASPYFIMIHDGATSADRLSKPMTETQEQEEPVNQRLKLREMILSFIGRGYNVALVNGLEWRDTKVMTMVMETRHRAELPEVHPVTTSDDVGQPAADMNNMLVKLKERTSTMSERHILAIIVASELLKDPPENTTQEQLIHFTSSFLLHHSLITHLPLSARRFQTQHSSENLHGYIVAVCSRAEVILSSVAWRNFTLEISSACDVVDLIDGRLLSLTYAGRTSPSSEPLETYKRLSESVEKLSGMKLSLKQTASIENTGLPNGQNTSSRSRDEYAVLPFSNPVFDQHLSHVRLRIDETAETYQSSVSHRIFREVTHWHNAKKPLIQKGPPTPASDKAAFWAAKRNQMFMAEMQKYAASLTNAVGRSLEPESIIVGASGRNAANLERSMSTQAGDTADSDSTDSSSVRSKHKPQPKKGGGGKKNAQNTGKQAMMAQIAASKAKKDEAAGDKIVNSWHVACKGFDADVDPQSRYYKAKEYFVNLQPAWKDVVGPECELYLVNALLEYWIEACRRKEKSKRIEVTALIWSHIGRICQSNNATKEIMSSVQISMDALALPSLPLQPVESQTQRKLGFTFVLPSKVGSLSVEKEVKQFQLENCGPYLERSFDSAPDARVDFVPDGWQREVLNGIDANKSLFVVAPTSAGKTFISFYAMRKVLEADDDGILVYVAPTKALVNQIAAEIQARYSKKFKYGGKSVWAIHTRDYRINNPTGCQVLVTVPHVLQIMLLAPTNANSWSSRVKRIIFDEVHSIGQAEDGVVWEQLLLLSPCPIVALSATVGNPSEFSDWLSTTQKAIGVDLITVQWPHRYSDLRKYYYVPPKRFLFQGLPEKTAFGTLGIEYAAGINRVHPVAGLVDKSRGIPEDLALEPLDLLELWKAMAAYQTGEYPVPKELDPEQALPRIVRKADILKWERNLKNILQEWIVDDASPYDGVIGELEKSFRNADRESLQATHATVTEAAASESYLLAEDDLTKSTLPLLCRLHEQDALPAILFNYDRHMCETICKALLQQLVQGEATQHKSGPKWDNKLQKWEDWKKVREKSGAKKSDASSKKSKTKSKDDGDIDDKTSKLDQQRDAGGNDASSWESFDPEAAIDGYHFANYSRVQASEMDLYTRQLRRREVQQWLIDGLRRGIGIHHAGMNRKYRQIVEILFRKGFLRVVIATGTLALGINMPCKTVVFSGDSVFLTALNYRQCAGRAGRRGFDLLGNVVFQGISREKVCRLISSRLPDLNGHFPITTTLVLRLFTLLIESKNAKYAVSSINALLSQPRLYMGGPSFKDQTMHHLRFSIEYLRRQCLLGSNGAPLNFAGLVSHLYFTENSSFAFHALLKEGYFHELCQNINTNEIDTLQTLMLVMSHLFNRIYCREADEEYKEAVVKPSSSIVFLPSLPEKAASILRQHNQQTLEVYTQYADSFAKQHISNEDRNLPLTGTKFGGDDSEAGRSSVHSLSSARVRSAFVALSGAGDDFDSISDLCQTARDGIFLEEAVVPHIGMFPEETTQPLNAWLLDFFKHGDVHTLERANGIRRADVWFLLNDFSLVLATIVASLMNFMKLKEGSDLDMLDVMGDLDAHEENEDEKVAASEEHSDVSGPSAADSAISMPERPKQVAKKKAKNTDSWEDIADEEDAIVAKSRGESSEAMTDEMDGSVRAWEGKDGGGEGLRNVLKAFTKLHGEFTVKFRAMWA